MPSTLKKILFALILSVWWVNCSFADIKAMWVTRFQMDSKQKIDGFIDTARDNGFNTLFVQVVGRGQAYYKSDIIPEVDCGFDPLAYAVEKSHTSGIKIHAWLNAYYVWSSFEAPSSPLHVVNRHPEWLDPGSKNSSKFLNPFNREVKDYLYNMYMEVASKYKIDGIHMDYIRYENEYGGLDYESRRAFSNSYWLDPVFLVYNSQAVKEYYGEEGYKKLKQKWVSYRCRQVSELVKAVYKGVKVLNPDMQVSAAVFPDLADAIGSRGQDWAYWVKSGYLDFVVPMIYSDDEKAVKKRIISCARAIRSKKLVVGLGPYKVSPEDFMKQFLVYKKVKKYYPSIAGFSLFSFDAISQNKAYLEKIKNGL